MEGTLSLPAQELMEDLGVMEAHIDDIIYPESATVHTQQPWRAILRETLSMLRINYQSNSVLEILSMLTRITRR